MRKNKVAIIVLNYKGVADTIACIQSLRKIKKSDIETQVIVVENDSQDGSAEELSQLKDIQLLTNHKNMGFSGGMNVGIKYALSRGFDAVVILNNDTIVDENFLECLNRTAKDADIITPKIYFAPGSEFHKTRYKNGERGKVIWYAGGEIDWQNIIGIHTGVDEVDNGKYQKREVSLATGCCMYIKSEVLEKIGLFNEKYFLYLEDMDFCVRAQRAGFKIMFEPRSLIWHKNASSAGGSGSSLQDYYITRNRLLFAAKYAKLNTKIALLKHVFKNSKDTIRRKALMDFLTFRFGRMS
ncbi:glycosyltransferase family 2 protein [Candidatus Curtissbacteria bacterium]|nr:glycosyltransferase family 2 protein [Candidatus Curtissbacteria bacterium]